MQPYFFPYIGYFQLMHAVDVFVFHDDVQYIKGGWINRNRILVDNRIDWLTRPVKNAASNLPINQRHFTDDSSSTDKLKRRIAGAYTKSQAFDDISKTVFDLLTFPDTNIASFNCNALTTIARKLGIRCRFVKSSEFEWPDQLRGQDKVIGLCRRLGADRYINPVGGVELYSPTAFVAAGISLSFLRTSAPATLTESGPQHLSVIDGLMHEGFNGYGQLLSRYTLFEKEYVRTQP